MSSYIFYRRSKRDKEPQWAIHTINLFKDYSGTVAELEIRYLGEKVRDLSVSKIAFWNHGALTIDSVDIVRADQLRVSIRGKSRILSAKLITSNNPASQPVVSTSLEKDKAFLEFSYLDRGQGFVLQVIHEGTSSNDLELQGVIKGVTKLRKIDLNEFINKTKRERFGVQIGQGFIVLMMTGFSFLCWSRAWDYWLDGKYGWLVVGILGGLLFIFATVGGILVLLESVRKVPPGLEGFYTDATQPQPQPQPAIISVNKIQ